jgi:hypothetical protein
MTAPDDAEVAAVVPAGRKRLPNRRGHELLDFEHFGITACSRARYSWR